jgi:hypothetical protein
MPAQPRFEESILALDPGGVVTPHLLREYGERHWVAQARDLDEVVTLLQAGRPGRAVVYVLASVVAGVAAAWTALR